jgi:hypothetical protein
MFTGLAGLLAGLFALGANPLPGVVIVLGGMAFLLNSTAKLCAVQVKRNDSVR